MTATTIRVQMAQRKDTAANWTAANPILLSGEIGYETDTKKFKIGNGSTNWNSLAYLPIPDGSGNLTITGNLEIGSTGSLTFEGSTADGFETTLAVTNPTADRTITLPNQSGNVLVSGNASIIDADIAANAEIAVSKLADGTARQLLQTDAAGTGVEWTSNVDIPGTLDVTGAATFDAAVTVAGDLTVNGTTTTISTQNLLVEDKNIIIGDVASPTDVTADGGGITLKGATDKTINWVDATDAWTSSERFSVPLGTAALPSLTFTGDPNTGIYSPGADQVAISTNSSERIRIGANGEIGIGGANYGTSGQVLTSGGSGAAPSWQTPAAANTDKIEEGNSSAEVIDTGSDGRFVVTTEGTERLRVDSSGRVGVGTASPNATLTLAASASSTAALSFMDTTYNSYPAIFSTNNSTGEIRLGGVNTAGTYYLTLYTQNTERARIDASGRLLVGTSSARSNFYNQNATTAVQIEGTTLATASLSITRNSNSASSADLILAKTRGTSVGDNTVVQNGDLLGYIAFQGADGTECVDGAAIECRVDGTPGANDMPGRLVFSTTADGASSPTERMRITNAGRVLFGATAPTAENEFFSFQGNNGTLSMFNVTGGASQWPIRTWNTGSSGTINHILFMDGAGTARGSITTNGSSASFNTTSDYRLKENIEPLANATQRLSQIPVHRFNFVGSGARVDGFIAHEVQTVVPEAITGEKDAVDDDGNPVYQGIDQSKLVPLLTAALQEAVAKIESLEARLTAAGI